MEVNSKLVIVILCAMFLFSCRKEKPLNLNEFSKIEIPYDELENNQLKADELFSSIEIVTLETNQNCLINQIFHFHFLKNVIAIFDKKQQKVFLFNQRGEHQFTIENSGRGPNQYIRIEDTFVIKDTLVLLDGLGKKLFYYNKFGNQLKIEDLGGPACVNIQILQNGSKLYYTGQKGSDNSDIRNHDIIIQVPERKPLLFLNNTDKREIKYLSTESYILNNGTEFFVHLPFENNLYQVENNDLFLKYKIDFGAKGLPGDFYKNDGNGGNRGNKTMKIGSDPQYYYLLGFVKLTKDYVILPVYNDFKVIGTVWYSKTRHKSIASKNIILGDSIELKVPKYADYKNTLVYTQYNNYQVKDKNTDELLYANPTIIFCKLKD